MDWSKFGSRKLLLTLLVCLVVTVLDLIGAPLDPESLDALVTLAQTLVGAQGVVDTAAAWKGGTETAEAIRALKLVVDNTAAVEPSDEDEPEAEEESLSGTSRSVKGARGGQS